MKKFLMVFTGLVCANLLYTFASNKNRDKRLEDLDNKFLELMELMRRK